MKALTLWQPWASLVALGVKSIETRSWSTSYRGQLAIHAAATMPSYQNRYVKGVSLRRESIQLGGRWWMSLRDVGPQRDLLIPPVYEGVLGDWEVPLGSVVATCTLVDCLPIHEWGCRCTRSTGLYLIIAPTSMQPEEIVGVFEFPGGAGVKHPDWSPSRLDCLDRAHPRQQGRWGDYRCGRWGWLLDDIKPLPEPVPARGRQQLWEWTP